ncbi:MAG: DUF1761 domain-containing protein [Archangium sp.]
MTDALTHLNWLGVLAATVAHSFLGGVWFMALFGKQYAIALGIADRPPQKPGPLFIVGPMVCSLITIATTAFLLRALQITSVGSALVLGLVIGVGYLTAMTVNIAINPLFPRPFRYAALNAPFFVLGSVMSSAILVAMS